MNGLDPVFGIHAQALSLQRRRLELLASNIANADTPGYQAKDLDFQSVLRQTLEGGSAPAAGAPAAAGGLAGNDWQYRVPVQSAVDGNTVDVQTEQAQYLDASMHYQASLSFLDGKLKSLTTAITGE